MAFKAAQRKDLLPLIKTRLEVPLKLSMLFNVSPQEIIRGSFFFRDQEAEAMVNKFDVNMMKELVRSKFDLIVIVCNFLVGFVELWPRFFDILIAPPDEDGVLTSNAIPYAIFCVMLLCIYLLSLLGVTRGNRIAKNAFICALFIMTIMVLIDDAMAMRYVFELEKTAEYLLRYPKVCWSLTEGIRWILWFIFNCWYFFVRGGKPRVYSGHKTHW